MKVGDITVFVSNGKVLTDVNGLAQDPKNINDWYFLAEGRVQTQYTGLAFYDNEWFYVVEGKLAEDYTGNVAYDGSEFYVVNGMVKANMGDDSINPNPQPEEDKENTTETDTEKEENVEENQPMGNIDEKAMAAYKRFLKNEETVYWYSFNNNLYLQELEEGKPYLLSELEEHIQEILIENQSHDSGVEKDETLDLIQYGFIDCGMDGKKELVLRFVGLDILFPNDESGYEIVIMHDGEKLVCIDELFYWGSARTWINYSGIRYYEGAESVDMWSGMLIFDSKGVSQDIYSMDGGSDLGKLSWEYEEYLKGEREKYYELEKVAYLYEEAGGWIDGIYIPYLINDKMYYVLSEEQDPNWEKFVRENGIKCYTEEEVQEIIKAYAKQVIGDEKKANKIFIHDKEIEWNVLEKSYGENNSTILGQENETSEEVDVEACVEQIRTWYYDTQGRLDSLLKGSQATNLECYYDGAYPVKVVARSGYNDWNANRECYYHDQELYFVFIHGNIGEYRLYVKDGALIRSISPDGEIVDIGQEWPQEILDISNRVFVEDENFPSMINCGA